MKKFLIMLIIGFILSLGHAAQAEMAFYMDAGLYSQYIGGDNGATVYDDAVLQGSVKLVYSRNNWGAYGKVWGSTPRNWNADFGSEIDYLFGVFTNWKNYSFNISYEYYDLYRIGNGDLSSISLKTIFPSFMEIRPYLRVQGLIPGDKNIIEGGMVYRAGVAYALPEISGKAVDLNLSLSGHDGALGKRPEPVSSVKLAVSTDFAFGSSTVTPAINFQKRLGYAQDNGGLTEDRVWASINISYAYLFK